MAIYNKPDVLPAWAESGDKVQPSNAEIQTGWPFSTVPPSRQRFNWVLNWAANAIRYLMQRGIPQWDGDEDYPLAGRVQHAGVTWVAILANTGVEPGTDPTRWQRWGYASTEILPRVDSLISISVAGSSSQTLTQTQYDNGIIVLTGLLTGNINVVLPNIARKWVFKNSTTGAFTVGLKTSSGASYLLPQGESQSIFCDANNVIAAAVVAFSVPDATTTVKGIVELATDAETQTGTDSVRATTPASVASAYLGKFYMLIQDQKPQNTGGGTSSAGNNTRVLNTVVANTISGASLASNQITLPAGTYRIKANAICVENSFFRNSLYNVTDAAIAILGMSEDGTSAVNNHGFVEGRITIASTKVFELRTQITTGGAGGLGSATNMLGVEIYSTVEIIKE